MGGRENEIRKHCGTRKKGEERKRRRKKGIGTYGDLKVCKVSHQLPPVYFFHPNF
jgi:hypothetical protein